MGNNYKDPNDPRIKQIRNRHYANNSQVYKDRAKAYRAVIAKATIELKNNPCMDCGGSFHYSAMDFDHRDKTSKVKNVGHIVSSMRLLLEEIAKCDLVCANCHRIRTWKRLRGWGSGSSVNSKSTEQGSTP